MTKVRFLIRESDAELDLFAYFPDIIFSLGHKMCYSHIGQHSACHPSFAKESRQANEPEYKDLLSELVSIGYEDLEIIN